MDPVASVEAARPAARKMFCAVEAANLTSCAMWSAPQRWRSRNSITWAGWPE